VDWEELLREMKVLLGKESRLIPLPGSGKAVFVGDTHGDLDATKRVIRRFLKKPYRIVFLGDYVDRGKFSRENLHCLLQAKREHPDEIFLLAGNHEGFRVKEFYPANFWESLPIEEQVSLGDLFSRFPLAASSQNGILALHGALPDLTTLDDVNRIELGDAHWERIVWGDFGESAADGKEDWGGRPQFGRAYFEEVMERYGKKVLIRSHQPHAPPIMYNKRCITIFTSFAYVPNRTVAVADLDREIRNADDIVLEKI
jgi:serine/threonine-protein phosphatase 2A catalytic subunit